MQQFEIPVLDPKQVEKLSKSELSHNEYICETAGFEPLEVRMKRFEQQGLLRQVMTSELTSQDLREMYLNPDYSLSPDDEPDDIIEKMQKINEHLRDIKVRAHERALKADGALAPKARQAVSAAADTEDESESESS